MEEDQTTQWPNETVQKDKQRSTKYTHKTKDRVTRTPLKTEVELLETLTHLLSSNSSSYQDEIIIHEHICF
jgi:hypothetical protein